MAFGAWSSVMHKLQNEHAVDRFKSAWLHKSLDNYCLRLKESAFVPWRTFVSEQRL